MSLLLVAFLVGPQAVWAHKGSDAYLTSSMVATSAGQSPRAQMRISIALKDLDLAVLLDSNADGAITWGEVRAAEPAVQAYLAQGMSWRAKGSDCTPRWEANGLERRSDGTYWVAQGDMPCDAQAVQMTYQLMDAVDNSHRLLLSGDWYGQPLLATMAPGSSFDLGSSALQSTAQIRWQTVLKHLHIGASHLLEGYDHLAFLLALVLPMSLPLWRRRTQHPHLTPQASDWTLMLSTVTAFTVGHSVTLGLVAWEIMDVSSDWVEPLIVLSIGVSAALNLRPVRWIRTDVLAGLFGLIHGMGFAGLLLEAQAPLALLPWALLGFNLGIEVAQLGVLVLWVLLLRGLKSTPLTQPRLVQGVSWSLIVFCIVLLMQFPGGD